MGRSKFPSKKSEGVRHFKLVARSSNDPNADDPGATPMVLEPYCPPGMVRKTGRTHEELLSIPTSLAGVGMEVFGLGEKKEDEAAPARGKLRKGRSRAAGEGEGEDEEEEDDEEEDEEAFLADLEEDCYFPRDGYNYEQHLKTISGGKSGSVGGFVLPAPVKLQDAPVKSERELKVQAARNAEEEEVLQALENAEEYEELEDEELDALIPAGAAEEMDEVLFGPTAAQSRDLPDLAALREAHKALLAAGGARGGLEGVEGEALARLLEEGVTVRSDAGLTESAEVFDRFLEEEYGDEEVGACDEDEIEGPITLEKHEEILDEYLQDKEEESERLQSIYEPQRARCNRDEVPRVIEETKAIIEKHYHEGFPESSSGEEEGGSDDETGGWDCESVLSTLSNLSNRPGKIGGIKVVKKPAPKLKAVREASLAEGAEATEDEEEEEEEEGGVLELPDVITERPRGETAEERRARKASVKEMRRVCRKMKKESKETYKAEALKLPAQQGTADVRRKLRCFKL